MTLAELHALDVPALWSSLTAEQQAAIGTAAVAFQFAGLVAGDDGTDTSTADRNAALELESQAQNGMADAVEAAFPAIEWWSA